MRFWQILLLSMIATTASAGDPGPPDPVEPTPPPPIAVTPSEFNTVKDWGDEPAPPVWHVGLNVGQSSWDCESDDCDESAGSEEHVTVAVAAGRTFRGWLRTELEAGYREHKIDNLGPACERKRSNYYGGCQNDQNDLRVWDVTVGVYPTIHVWERFSLYAGGGLGLVIVDGLNQVDVAGVGKVRGGAEIAVYKGLSLDVGYGGLWALSSMSISGFDLKQYTSHGFSAGLRLRWF